MIENKKHEATFKRWVKEGIKKDHISLMLEMAYEMGIKEGKAVVIKNAIDFISK